MTQDTAATRKLVKFAMHVAGSKADASLTHREQAMAGLVIDMANHLSRYANPNPAHMADMMFFCCSVRKTAPGWFCQSSSEGVCHCPLVELPVGPDDKAT